MSKIGTINVIAWMFHPFWNWPPKYMLRTRMLVTPFCLKSWYLQDLCVIREHWPNMTELISRTNKFENVSKSECRTTPDYIVCFLRDHYNTSCCSIVKSGMSSHLQKFTSWFPSPFKDSLVLGWVASLKAGLQSLFFDECIKIHTSLLCYVTAINTIINCLPLQD